ncbi:MAG: polysaccharide deacetylase family sporulation protein PdaB [Peptococcaceae bacterium]|nr:polysaccharide deacetylase family sporulation protein PdaB [Peptococcaceae bacterium]
MRVYYLDFKKWKRNLMFSALVLLIAFLMVMALWQEPITFVTTDAHSRIVYKVKTDKKVAALTFDISWGEKIPEPVLDILKEKDVKCTFFLSGPWVARHKEIAKRIAEEGHEIGSHGWKHENYSEMSNDQIKEEIRKAHDTLKEITGQNPTLIRTPNGDWNEQVLDAIFASGYTAIQWSVDSLDWKDIGAEASKERVLRLIHPGAIILMHASDSAEQTPESLPKIIDGLREKGYELVTVSKLLEYGKGVAE